MGSIFSRRAGLEGSSDTPESEESDEEEATKRNQWIDPSQIPALWVARCNREEASRGGGQRVLGTAECIANHRRVAARRWLEGKVRN
jgi:hypothetical protein